MSQKKSLDLLATNPDGKEIYGGILVTVDNTAVTSLPDTKNQGEWDEIPQNAVIEILGDTLVSQGETAAIYQSFVQKRAMECKILRVEHKNGESKVFQKVGTHPAPTLCTTAIELYCQGVLALESMVGVAKFEEVVAQTFQQKGPTLFAKANGSVDKDQVLLAGKNYSILAQQRDPAFSLKRLCSLIEACNLSLGGNFYKIYLEFEKRGEKSKEQSPTVDTTPVPTPIATPVTNPVPQGMNFCDLTQFIHTLSATKTLSEKVLVVQQRAQGRRLLQTLTRNGITLLNVSVETPLSLSTGLCLDCGEILTVPQAEAMIFALLQEETEGFFVKQGVISPVLAKELYHCFLEMSKGDWEEKNLPPDSKVAHVFALWTAYQDKKQEKKVLDQGDLFHMAQKQKASRWKNTEFFFFEQFSPVELTFLQGLSEKPLTQFQFPIGDTAPIFQAEPCQFYACRGQETEVRQVFRHIHNEKYPVEDCVVVYLDPSYRSLLYKIAARWAVPVSITIPLSESLIASTLAKLDRFSQSDFPLAILYDLLQSGACTPKERGNLAKLLKNRVASYGEALYHSDFSQDTLGFAPTPEDIAQFESLKAEHGEHWADFFRCILRLGKASLPVEEQKQDLRHFLQHFLPHSIPAEVVAYQSIFTLLDQATWVYEPEEGSLLSRLLRLVEESSYTPSATEENPLLCLPLEQAILSGKKHLFLVGLSRYALEQGKKESPILLDMERDAYFTGLETTKTQSRHYETQFDQLIAGHFHFHSAKEGGSVVLLHSNFDSERMVKQSPAPYYTRALEYCTQGGKGGEEVVEYVLSAGVTVGDTNLTNPWIQPDYPLSPLQGGGQAVDDMADIIKNFVFSATSLEEARDCPLKFYLSRILKLKDRSLEEVKEDVWFPKHQRGTFIHAVLEHYYNKSALEENVDLESLFQVEFALLEKEHPCQKGDLNMERIKEKERLLMWNWVQEATEWTTTQGRDVVSSELDFGKDSPLPLTFGNYTLLLSGTVDRVDKINGKTHILDYKTGNSKYFLKHEHWQHYLYTLAYEAISDGDKVEEAGYLLLNPSTRLLSYPQVSDPQERVILNRKIALLLEFLSNEKNITTPCPCFVLDENKNTLVVSDSKTRKKAHKNCEQTCDYVSFCGKEVEELV